MKETRNNKNIPVDLSNRPSKLNWLFKRQASCRLCGKLLTLRFQVHWVIPTTFASSRAKTHHFFVYKVRRNSQAHTLEVNHHVKNGGSFWLMINPYFKKIETHKPTYQLSVAWWTSSLARRNLSAQLPVSHLLSEP